MRMSDPVFLQDSLGEPVVGATVTLDGNEGRHAATVRRIRPGERLIVADGRGHGVAGTVAAVGKASLELTVEEILYQPEPALRYVAVQALAKGDRSELAVEMLTEIGVSEIVPWQASRSVVRWSADKAPKAAARWQATAREAAKQSRRVRVPAVSEVVTTRELLGRVSAADLALVLHEQAADRLADVRLPGTGTVVVIIGPEGGIADDELASLVAAGGHPVLISDGVLRTSTAGVVACAALMIR